MKLLCLSFFRLFCITSAVLSHGAPEKGNSSQSDVSIQNLQFSPAAVTIHVGDKIVWTNNDDRDYNVVSKDGSFKSGNLRSGQTFEHVFTAAGTFAYACSYHPRMKGTITVLP